MTDQYGRAARPGRALMVATVVLSALVAGPSAAAAVPGGPSPSPAVRTTPAVRSTTALTDKRIVEPTGLAMSSLHRGVMWVISGKTLFAVTSAGRTVGTYTFGGLPPVDFEALAVTTDEQGHPVLLIGDTGDPHRSRSKGVWLYRVREPERLGNATLRPLRYRLQFPDGPQDARTLLVDPSSKRVYLVSMSSTGGNVYALPAALGLGMGNAVTKVNPVHFVAQDGGFLPDGRVILRGKYQAHVLERIGGRRLAFLQLPREADGPLAVLPGGASILVAGTASASRLWQLRIPDIPAAAPTPGRTGISTVKPVPLSSNGPLSSRTAGVASLVGLLAIAVLGGAAHLRRRSRPPR
jgi:hypothetical protein